MTHIFSTPFTFNTGTTIKNRALLAPMTNTQSHDDGTLSTSELTWLRSRASGGFGAVITAAAQAHPKARSYPGQLGAYADSHIPGLSNFSASMREHNALSILQLIHGGSRNPSALNDGQAPTAPSAVHLNFPGYEVPHAFTESEIESIIDSFVAAAQRAVTSGIDGIELHAANGYLFTQFLSTVTNTRKDKWGGSLANRARFLLEVVRRIRRVVPETFIVGVRLLGEDSPSQKGFSIDDTLEVVRWLNSLQITYIHLSSGDIRLTSWFHPKSTATNIHRVREVLRKDVALIAVGGINTASDAEFALHEGADLIAIGRAAIATPDWPRQAEDNHFTPQPFPMTPHNLLTAGISERFMTYLNTHGLVS